MTSFKSHYFENKHDANSFLYGYADQYCSNLPSFKNDIFPKILENYLVSEQNGVERHSNQYFQEEMNILYGIESLHKKLPILKSYIQADFAFSPYMILDINPRHYDKKLNEYKQKGGILALLVTLKRPHDACLEELIEILDFVNCIGNEVILKGTLPKKIIPAFKRYFISCFDNLTGFFQNDELRNLLKNIEFKQSNPVKQKASSEGYKVHTYNGVSSVLYEQLEVSEKLFVETVSDESSLLQEVFFKNCHFSFDAETKKIKSNVVLHFENCVFENVFKINDLIKRSIEFCCCSFCGHINFNGAFINNKISFTNCVFNEQSHLSFDRTQFNKMVKLQLYFENCIIRGKFSIQTPTFYPELHLINVSLLESFNIKTKKFVFVPEITNLCFPSKTTEEMEASKRQLYDTLVSSNLKEMAEELNLLSDKKKKTDFDYNAYQIAYDSGWLKPEYAAYFLGKSVNYLAKKRISDKKQISRDSLPYKMDGRDIQYPVEALLAFKAKDWDTLKNLRKKYPIPTK